MANAYGDTYEEMRNALRRRFDGYHFGKRLKGVYNPFSILNTFSKMDIRDYWFKTGTPAYLVRLMQDYHENLNDLAGKYYDESEFVDYRADREMPLPMIYQSGYLTIKDYDREMESFSYTLYLIFRIASCYITYIEKEQSYGRLECCVETAKHVYIFEFKLDGSAAEALKQIEERGYATEFLASGKTIYKVGVNISSETGTVADWKVG